MVRVAIAGPFGKMGSNIIKKMRDTKKVSLSAIILKSLPTPEHIADLTAWGLTKKQVSHNITDLLSQFDVLIDFTSPSATIAHLQICAAAGKSIVIGTTGFSEEDNQFIRQNARLLPIVFDANFSIGVNIMKGLLKKTAHILHNTLGSGTDIDIIEAHHRDKVDAPSGTALALGEVIAETIGVSLSTNKISERYLSQVKRDPNCIGFSSIRGGDIVGEHTVLFAGIGERLEITHKATDRAIFAAGAVQAAAWLAQPERVNGLFNMQDVLGI